MATVYPGGIDAFTDPIASTPLDDATNPHAGQHVDKNDAIEAIESRHQNAAPIRLTNRSGASRAAGDVVIRDGANDTSYTTTAIQGDDKVVGAVRATTANLAEGDVIPVGRVTIAVQEAVTRGNFLRTSTTAGKAEDAGTAIVTGVFAMALTGFAGPGAGTVAAFLFGTTEGGATFGDTPSTQAHDDAASEGVSANSARGDHKHKMPSAGGAWVFVETITLTGASIATATLPTMSDMFMLVFADARSSVGALRLRPNSNTDADKDYVTHSAADPSVFDRVEGQTVIQLASSTASIYGQLIFNRTDDTAANAHAFIGPLSAGNMSGSTLFVATWRNTADITTIQILSATGTLSGKMHVYRLSQS